MKLTKNFWTKMIPVFVMVFATIFLSVSVYTQMVETEKESCWERLEIATGSTAGKIKVRLDDNTNFLKAVSDSYILTHNIDNAVEVGKYLNSVMEMTIFERIDVIQPDNTLITQTGEIVKRGGKLTFEELAADGISISGRRTSSFTGREVICCTVPIEENGEILGVLVGTMDCGTLSNLFEVATYGKEAQIFLIDCADGNYLIDNWHQELGNIKELGIRKGIDGTGIVDMTSAIMNREEARFAYISETNGENSYQYCAPVDGYNWELCVVVQEDVVFDHANDLRDILLRVGVVEAVLVFLYITWNILLARLAYKSEEKAMYLEYEKAKNEARSRFISNMSHDIRTPLNGIVGMLQIIKNHRSDEERVDDCLRKIAVSTEYLSTLASDMLDINEIENNKLVLQEDQIDIKQLAEELDVVVGSRAKDSHVEYHMDCSKLQHPYVIGSEVHIKRILVNLIGNAIKYSKDAGRKVWVTISDEAIDSDLTKRMYKFVIKDNGIGMTEEFQKNMYNAFEQEKQSARSAYQGYGLGLTIVNYLVKKMNGEIDLESKKGVGSTFTVLLPFKLDEKDRSTEQDEDTTVNLNGVRILIVEDNEFNREVAETLLTDAGAEVSTALNGEVAVQMFETSEPGTYHLIVMDIMMPVMDGCEATRQIRAMDREDAKEIPIIAMTASTFAEEIKRCEEAGMNAHIAKPLDVNKLLAEVGKYSRKMTVGRK